jgi:hypothetical protein
VVLNAVISTNSHNVIVGKPTIGASDELIIPGGFEGTAALAGASLSGGAKDGYVIRLSAAFAGISASKTTGSGAHNTILWAIKRNAADGSFEAVGQFLINVNAGSNLNSATMSLLVAKLDSSLNFVSASAPSFAGGPVTLTSWARGLDVVICGGSGYVTGDFHTDSGVALTVGSSSLVSVPSTSSDVVVAQFSLSTQAPVWGNQLYASQGKGTSLACSAGGLVWVSGNIYISGNFSGVVLTSTNYNYFLASISASGVFASASSAGTSAGTSSMKDIDIGADGVIALTGEAKSTVNYGPKKVSPPVASAVLVTYQS